MRVAGLGTAAADDDIAIVEGVGIGHRQHKAHFCIAPIATSSVSARTIQRVAMDRFKKMLQTMAMVSSTDFLRASERTTAIATLNRQRHLTPSCGGVTPTAERTVGPARMIVGELDTHTRN